MIFTDLTRHELHHDIQPEPLHIRSSTCSASSPPVTPPHGRTHDRLGGILPARSADVSYKLWKLYSILISCIASVSIVIRRKPAKRRVALGVSVKKGRDGGNDS